MYSSFIKNFIYVSLKLVATIYIDVNKKMQKKHLINTSKEDYCMGNLYVANGDYDMTTIPEEKHQEYFAKCEEYTKYVDNHRKNVVRAYLYLFMGKEYPEIGEYDGKEITKNVWKFAWQSIAHDIISHDISKYEDDEFYHYRAHYYPMDGEEQNEEAFEEAWKHHYTVNDHHPEHWADINGNPKNMPLPQVIHMMCDWASFAVSGDGDAFVFDKNETVEFWNKEKVTNRKKYTEEMVSLIDRIIDIL